MFPPRIMAPLFLPYRAQIMPAISVTASQIAVSDIQLELHNQRGLCCLTTILTTQIYNTNLTPSFSVCLYPRPEFKLKSTHNSNPQTNPR